MVHIPLTVFSSDANASFRRGASSVEHLHRINKASAVALAEAGVLSVTQATHVACGLLKLIEQDQHGPCQTSADYLEYEARLSALIGTDASRLHCGRSRQDIAATIARMNLRDGLLSEYEALLTARQALLDLARRHTRTLIPAYTHGVQAQPTTFAHYLLGFAAAFGRQTERMRAAFGRINKSPLGAAVLTTSSFPLNRRRLAALLGFESPLDNSFDANHLSPVDSSLELAGVFASLAVQVGQLAQDLHAHYQAAVPWLTLSGSELVGISSAMPQKRNPAALEQLRVQSSILLGQSQAVALTAHNVRTGMFDYRAYDPVPSESALLVLDLLRKVLSGVVVNEARALAEIHSDYSTSTEIADSLLQRADIPFRTGHEFASALTDLGRSQGLSLRELRYEATCDLYESMTSQPMPLSSAEFAQAIDPMQMVFGRLGLGGPQVAEVERMLSQEAEQQRAGLNWFSRQRSDLTQADDSLDAAIGALVHA